MQTHRIPAGTRRNSQETANASRNSSAMATGRKFMLTLRETVFKALQESADQRGVTVQGLIRAVIVPEWHLEHAPLLGNASAQNYSSRPDQPAMESVSTPAWPKTRKTDEDNIRTKVVA